MKKSYVTTILSNNRGTTIFDVLITIALVSSIAAIAIPNGSKIQDSFNRATALAQVHTDLRRARAEAVAAGARTVLSISVAQNSYDVGLDFAPYTTPPVIETRRFGGALPTGITIQTSADIIFDPRGYLVDDSGDPTQIDLTFLEDGTSYKVGTLYAAGYLDY